MPKIGSIEVPEDLWKELLKFSIIEFPRTMLKEVGGNYRTVDSAKRMNEFEQFLGDQYAQLEQRIASLIRNQTGNQQLDFNSIERRQDYQEIWSTARRTVDQVSFDAMFNLECLRNLAEDYIRRI